MEIKNLQRILSKLLNGAQLDSIRVYSIALDLEFNQISKSNLPTTIYITTSNPIYLLQDFSQVSNTDYKVDFYKQRGKVINQLYSMIGQEIKSVQLSKKGELTIAFDEKNFFLSRDVEEFETIWEVMDITTDPKIEHNWYISWSEFNEIEINVSENF
ncbi:hypothetical protein [Leptospira santarosai]|uniref:hypothetical protein n=1 Tax=Leptospira santarosai TaxID=28183 RepID=UPI00036D44C6|nr:hypothetical protein [Leptospira santarosai]MDI7158059.1 hypothetical protein [Leptospira santarosai]